MNGGRWIRDFCQELLGVTFRVRGEDLSPEKEPVRSALSTFKMLPSIQQTQPRIDMQKAEYHEFKGGHTIPPDVVDRFVQILVSQSAEALCSLSAVSLQRCGCPTQGFQSWKVLLLLLLLLLL